VRFSGHETFPVREGWLYKGLQLLIEEPRKLFDMHAADYLGVGANMAKSIRYWLQTTGLAFTDASRKGQLTPTELGQLIAEHDPYFIDVRTWWLLHINTLTPPAYATTWEWFFNTFNLERFDRAVATENLRQFIQLRQKALPSPKTLERDLTCLLATYAMSIPSEDDDPEEARDSPFRELRLLRYYRASGKYHLQYHRKDIHPCVFGYCVSRAFEDAGFGDISIQRLTREPGGPGRAFVLTHETLFELLVELSVAYPEFHIHGHAGQRALAVPKRPAIDWIEEMYQETNGR